MRKKRISVLCLATGLMTALGLGGAAVALKHEPHFYGAALVEPGAQRKHDSIKFIGNFGQLIADLEHGRDDWQFEFTEGEINSFFQEDVVNYGEAEKLRKLGVSEPRIALEDGQIRLGFRYGSGFWSSVISYDLRIWVVPKETNLLAVEILGRRAGALPISCQSLLPVFTELATPHNIEVTPYRHDGHPVALLRFQGDQSRPSAQLKCLRIAAQTILIAGCSGSPRH